MTDLLGELAEQLDRWHVPGLEVVAVRDGEVVACGGVGVRGVDDPEAVGSRTLFQHGSCGKAYTGLLAALLAEDGLVDLDAPLRRHVPELRLPDEHAAARVSLRDVLSHRSGLGRHDLTWILAPDRDRTDLVRRLEHLPLSSDLRSGWEYSNLGFTLAGEALGRAAGTSWEQELRDRVLTPLGMTRTYVTYADVPAEDVAQPHLLFDDKPVVAQARRFDGAAPAGQLVSCAEDTVRWLLLHTGEPLLPATAVAATHAASSLMPPTPLPYPELDLYGYGFGWVVGTYRGHRLRWHSGGVDGFLTQTLVLPERRTGVLVSANLHSSELPFAAVLHAADRLLGEDSQPSWFDRLRETADAAAEPARPERHDVGPTRELSAYAGTYRDPGYGDVVVTATDAGLTVRVADTDLRTAHRHFDTWDLHYAPLQLDLDITFGASASGDVVEAVLPLDATGPTRFVRVTA